MTSQGGSKPWCYSCRKDLCGSPEAWNVTTTLFSGFLIIIGFYFLTRTCFVPENDTPTLDCAAHSAYLVPDKAHTFYFLVCTFMFFAIFLFQLLVMCGITCDGFCNNKRSSVFLAAVSLGLVIYFVVFLDGILNQVPKTSIADPDACLVCPDADDPWSRFLLTLSTIVSGIGLVGTLVTCYVSSDRDWASSKGYRAHLNSFELRQQCTIPQDDVHRRA